MSEFKVRHYNIYSSKINNPVTAVMLCDLHDRSYGVDNIRLLEAIHGISPDMVLIAGDMVVGRKETDLGAEESRKLNHFNNAEAVTTELASRYPVFYSSGNHESYMKNGSSVSRQLINEYIIKLKKTGVCFLDNNSIAGIFQENSFQIHGLEMNLKYYKKRNKLLFDKKDLETLLGVCPKNQSYQILLAHNPVYFDSYSEWGADLTLSGHLHGGIVRLPLLGGMITPQARLFPKYDRGHFQRDGKNLIVGAGLGEHTIKIRFYNPRELVVIHFFKK